MKSDSIELKSLIQVLNEIALFVSKGTSPDFLQKELSRSDLIGIPTTIYSFEISEDNFKVYFEQILEDSGSHTYGINERITFRLEDQTGLLLLMTNSGPWLTFEFTNLDAGLDETELKAILNHL